MIIREIKLKELKKADNFQQSILNPEKKKRYRPYHKIKKYYHRNPSLFIGAFNKNKIIGIVFGRIIKNMILLCEMAVSEKYRGKEIGKKLLRKFEDNSKKLNKNYIQLGAWESAEKFYLKAGYEPLIFVQIYHNKVLKNYKNLGYNIIKETNYTDSKRLFIKIDKYNSKIKEKIKKNFNAYDVIYLFRKEINI
jgi:GNAT superfamily N-acetyltransferase